MARPEATQVLSSVWAAVSALKSVEEVHDDASDAESLPPAFPAVAEYVSVICDALGTVQKQVRKRSDDDICGEMKPAAAGCKEKACLLETVFMKAVPSAAGERMEQQYRDAARTADPSGDNRVETLMRGIIEDTQLLLTMDDTMKAAAETQLGKLGEARKEVLTIPDSLPVENPASGINNYGPGAQNVNTSTGTQNNNNGAGQQFIGGVCHGFNAQSK